MNRIFDFNEIQPELNARYAEYLENKSVAIVGRAELDRTEQGTHIDSFDVIVRVHWPIPYHAGVGNNDRSEDRSEIKWDPPPFVPKQWKKYVGVRTDVFYTTIVNGGEQWCQDIVATFVEEGGQFICCEIPWVQRKRTVGMLRQYYPVRNVNMELYCELQDMFGSQPLGGTLVIADICRHNVKSVYLTGFPCFVDDEHPTGTVEGTKHSYNDFCFLRKLAIESRERVTVDAHMAQLFKKF